MYIRYKSFYKVDKNRRIRTQDMHLSASQPYTSSDQSCSEHIRHKTDFLPPKQDNSCALHTHKQLHLHLSNETVKIMT